ARRGMDRTSLLLKPKKTGTDHVCFSGVERKTWSVPDLEALMAQRWKQRPPGSNWGDFGPDDQRGRMNYVPREKVLQGIPERKEGTCPGRGRPSTFPAGAAPNPGGGPPRLAATIRDGKSAGKQNFCFPLAEDEPDLTDVVSDDRVLLTLQYSTQWDSFAHIGS